MLGAVVGGIASALAGGAASKLFGGKPAAQAATESSGLSNGQGVIGMDQDAGIQSAIQGSNVPNGHIPAPTQTGGVMSDAKNMIKNAGKDLLDGVMTAGSDRIKQALVDKLSGNDAKKQGQATRDYLAAAFPELNAWERAGAGASGAGYNVHQSEIAIGSGGLEGKGFLNGTQTKLKFVPEQDTDFIFCTVGEEEGFLGSAGVLLLFLALILRLIHLAERQPFRFGRVYGYSVVSVFLFHVFINVGMVLGLTPVIGIPLPFFSYGGSSLWGFTFLLFIFLRIDAGRKAVRS